MIYDMMMMMMFVAGHVLHLKNGGAEPTVLKINFE
jgi:uncharacterized protein YodC (DUF2158 family)